MTKKRWSEFLDFCEANDFPHAGPNVENTIFGYVSQLTDDGMALRSIKNYLSHVRKGLKGFCALTFLKRRLDKAITKAPRRHALDASPAEIREMLGLLELRNARVAAIAVAMMWCGLRYEDLCNIPRRYWKLWEDPNARKRSFTMAIDVKEAKNILKDIQRKRLFVGVLVFPDCIPVAALTALTDWYRDADPEDCLAVGTVNEFNSYLAPFETLVLNRSFTSYSFRRFAFQRFIAHCTNREGEVDWKTAISYSLHMKEDTLRAFYQGPVEE